MNKYASTKSEETLLNFNDKNYEMYDIILYINIQGLGKENFSAL